jgi:hypothetical protein
VDLVAGDNALLIKVAADSTSGARTEPGPCCGGRRNQAVLAGFMPAAFR